MRLMNRIVALGVAMGLLVSTSAFPASPPMRRGINMFDGAAFWNDPTKIGTATDDLARIHGGGFDTVRIVLNGFEHMDADNRLDPRWLVTLDEVIKAAAKVGLNVILDEHDYIICGESPDICRPRLLAFWRQVAPRYRHAPKNVLFEILNEPNHALTAERWNALLVEALAVIRRSDPKREVIIGPTDYNNMHSLAELQLPDNDHHLLVTVHYYLPFSFTHQGATWVKPSLVDATGVSWGSPAERAQMDAEIDAIADWGKSHRRPLLIGEFGAYDKGEMKYRAAWTAQVAREAEAHRIAWCYWDFAGGFAVFDRKRSEWITPIHEALIPK